MSLAGLPELTTCHTLVWQRATSATRERVFTALTDPGELGSWMDAVATVDCRLGGSYVIEPLSPDAVAVAGVICELDDPAVLAYRWGTSLVHWEIKSSLEGTAITFSLHGIATERVASTGAFWEGCIEQLEDHLEQRSLATMPERLARQEELRPAFASLVSGAASR